MRRIAAAIIVCVVLAMPAYAPVYAEDTNTAAADTSTATTDDAAAGGSSTTAAHPAANAGQKNTSTPLTSANGNNTVSITTNIPPSVTVSSGSVNTNNNMSDSANTVSNGLYEPLTVDQATQNAINASSSIKNYSDSVTTNNESLDKLKDQFSTETDYGTVLNLAVQIMQAQVANTQTNNNANLARDTLRISVMNVFASIISAQNALNLMDRSLDIQKKQLTIAKVKYSLGYTSKLDMDTQTNNYNQKTASRKTQQIAIDNAFISLNKLMGMSLNRKYNLILDVGAYKPVGDINLQATLDTAMRTDPTIINQQGNVDVANYKIKMYDPDVSTQSLDDVKMGVDQAERALSDARSAVAQKVVNAYNNILNEEVSYNNAVLALQALNIQLPVTQKQLELGKITPLDLEQLQYQIAQQEETIRSLTVTHAINVIQFNEPATL